MKQCGNWACAKCLWDIGFGRKAIVRATGLARTTIRRRFGVRDGRRKTVNIHIIATPKPKRVKPTRPPRPPRRTKQEHKAAVLAWYYEHHAEQKERARKYQHAKWLSDPEKARTESRNRQARAREQVTLGYVRKVLTQNNTCLRARDLPDDLVRAEQQRIKLKREVCK